jgi:hypothetical protein
MAFSVMHKRLSMQLNLLDCPHNLVNGVVMKFVVIFKEGYRNHPRRVVYNYENEPLTGLTT